MFFFNDTPTTEMSTLSLLDALPIWRWCRRNPTVSCLSATLLASLLTAFVAVTWQWREAVRQKRDADALRDEAERQREVADRKSTRLNSSHANISYAVFCLKKSQGLA